MENEYKYEIHLYKAAYQPFRSTDVEKYYDNAKNVEKNVEYNIRLYYYNRYAR